MNFSWDERKNKLNIQKHNVSFELAKLIFDDPHLVSVPDERFRYEEARWHSIGSAAGTLLIFVAHIMEINEYDQEIIRIISARKAEKNERQRYLQSYS